MWVLVAICRGVRPWPTLHNYVFETRHGGKTTLSRRQCGVIVIFEEMHASPHGQGLWWLSVAPRARLQWEHDNVPVPKQLFHFSFPVLLCGLVRLAIFFKDEVATELGMSSLVRYHNIGTRMFVVALVLMDQRFVNCRRILLPHITVMHSFDFGYGRDFCGLYFAIFFITMACFRPFLNLLFFGFHLRAISLVACEGWSSRGIIRWSRHDHLKNSLRHLGPVPVELVFGWVG